MKRVPPSENRWRGADNRKASPLRKISQEKLFVYHERSAFHFGTGFIDPVEGAEGEPHDDV